MRPDDGGGGALINCCCAFGGAETGAGLDTAGIDEDGECWGFGMGWVCADDGGGWELEGWAGCDVVAF